MEAIVVRTELASHTLAPTDSGKRAPVHGRADWRAGSFACDDSTAIMIIQTIHCHQDHDCQYSSKDISHGGRTKYMISMFPGSSAKSIVANLSLSRVYHDNSRIERKHRLETIPDRLDDEVLFG